MSGSDQQVPAPKGACDCTERAKRFVVPGVENVPDPTPPTAKPTFHLRFNCSYYLWLVYCIVLSYIATMDYMVANTMITIAGKKTGEPNAEILYGYLLMALSGMKHRPNLDFAKLREVLKGMHGLKFLKPSDKTIELLIATVQKVVDEMKVHYEGCPAANEHKPSVLLKNYIRLLAFIKDNRFLKHCIFLLQKLGYEIPKDILEGCRGVLECISPFGPTTAPAAPTTAPAGPTTAPAAPTTAPAAPTTAPAAPTTAPAAPTTTPAPAAPTITPAVLAAAQYHAFGNGVNTGIHTARILQAAADGTISHRRSADEILRIDSMRLASCLYSFVLGVMQMDTEEDLIDAFALEYFNLAWNQPAGTDVLSTFAQMINATGNPGIRADAGMVMILFGLVEEELYESTNVSRMWLNDIDELAIRESIDFNVRALAIHAKLRPLRH